MGDCCDCATEWISVYECGLLTSGQRVSYRIPLTSWVPYPSEELNK